MRTCGCERAMGLARMPRRESNLSATMRPMSRAAALVDEIANELASWPGVRIERLSEAAALVRYESLDLGVLDRQRGLAERRFSNPEREELVEHGDAEPSDSMPEGVSHGVHGPADVTTGLGLFDRRYTDLR